MPRTPSGVSAMPGAHLWAPPPGSSCDCHPLFPEPERAVLPPMGCRDGKEVSSPLGIAWELAPGVPVSVRTEGFCGGGGSSGALQRLLGTLPASSRRRAGREMGQQVRGLASPRRGEKREVRRTRASLVRRSLVHRSCPGAGSVLGSEPPGTRGVPAGHQHGPGGGTHRSCSPPLPSLPNLQHSTAQQRHGGTQRTKGTPFFPPPAPSSPRAARWQPGTTATHTL